MSTLLQFHKTILEKIHDPATSELLVIARGLGLRRIICTLLKIYDSPESLVLLVNATPEEESAIGEELGIMGCRKPGLRVLGYETASKERCVSFRNIQKMVVKVFCKAGTLQKGRADFGHFTDFSCGYAAVGYSDTSYNGYNNCARRKVCFFPGIGATAFHHRAESPH
jgi:hypothetical protein